MAAKRAKPGPKKGVSKPYKRPLDPKFPTRLRAAMARYRLVRADGTTLNAELARKVPCERATIGQYLNEDKPRATIDAPLLLALCDALSVSPYWLMFNQGSIDDVPINKRPMEDVRKLPARAQTRRDIEETAT